MRFLLSWRTIIRVGVLRPSQQDKELTERIMKCGKLMDIAFMDHVILTSDSYYSFADNGFM